MKKSLAYIFIAMVSWALVGTPVQAAQTSHHKITLVKHKKHKKKKHRKHKKL